MHLQVPRATKSDHKVGADWETEDKRNRVLGRKALLGWAVQEFRTWNAEPTGVGRGKKSDSTEGGKAGGSVGGKEENQGKAGKRLGGVPKAVKVCRWPA